MHAANPPIIPTPRTATAGRGHFRLHRPLSITFDQTGDLAADAWTLLRPILARAATSLTGGIDAGELRFEPWELEDTTSPGGYELEVGEDRIVLRAADRHGFLHGIQSLRQLLPPACEKPDGRAGAGDAIRAVHIVDAPRFAWRGLHVDVARHYFDPRDLERLIDAMALHKFNRLHWHLTDDQGWRLEIDGWPRLTEVGAKRAESPRRGARDQGDGTPYEGHYTQDEARRLVAYAHARGIDVIPEIEMPGHAQAALAAYPELGHGPPPEVWTRWGISERIYNVEDETLAFLEEVLAQVARIFPSPYVHLGGDEVPTTEWEQSKQAQMRMAAEGLESPKALQGWFLRRMAAVLDRLGKRAVAWDEVLECGAPTDAIVMTWRDAAFAWQAAARGHDVVVCPMSHCYFDHYQGPPESEPEAIGGLTELRKVLAFEPLQGTWSEAEEARVLGVQGNLWSEYIHDPAHLEYMAWPRASALAEIAWSPRGPRDPAEFEERWAHVAKRLRAMDVFFRSLHA